MVFILRPDDVAPIVIPLFVVSGEFMVAVPLEPPIDTNPVVFVPILIGHDDVNPVPILIVPVFDAVVARFKVCDAVVSKPPFGNSCC